MKYVLYLLLCVVLIAGCECPKPQGNPPPTQGASLILNTIREVPAYVNVAGSYTTEATPPMKLKMYLSMPTGAWNPLPDIMIPPGPPRTPERYGINRDPSSQQQVKLEGWYETGGAYVQMGYITRDPNQPNTYRFTMANDANSPGIIVETEGLMP